MKSAEKTSTTIREILQQPRVWAESLNLLNSSDFFGIVEGAVGRQQQWLLTGCGTSYYLAQAAAASLTLLTSQTARALPASEILLYPQLSLSRGENLLTVLISRSGCTSEILAVAQLLKGMGYPFIGLTCDGNELALIADTLLQLPVKEESIVMTSSFTSMLLALQFIAAKLAANDRFLAHLQKLPALAAETLKNYAPSLEAFAGHQFEDIAVLGQGFLYPIAAESALKIMESSSTYAQFFHTLEFRHGPKSIVQDRTLVIGLISDESAQQELRVLREMKDLGALTMAVVNTKTADVSAAANLTIEFGSPLPTVALQCAYVLVGQLLGSYIGLAKNMNPDKPRNLSRAVTF